MPGEQFEWRNLFISYIGLLLGNVVYAVITITDFMENLLS